VITGLGVVTALGNTLGEFEKNLREGRSGIAYHEDLENFRCQVAGIPEATDTLAEVYFPKNRLAYMDDVNRYGCIAAVKAWEDAGLEVPPLGEGPPDWDSGAVIGSGSHAGHRALAEDLSPAVVSGNVRRLGAKHVHRTLSEGIVARTAEFLGLGNKVIAASSTSATGLAAILDGVRHIQHGYADRMVCGGAEGSGPYAWAALDAVRVTAKGYKDEPHKASRPMSKSATGLVPSGGAGVVVLERLESAERRGARIYAEVLGHHTNCGAQREGGSMTAPNLNAVQRCIRKALVNAKIRPLDVSFINGHLTGTMADALEVRCWREVYGDSDLPFIHSTKSLLGHTLQAAGGIEVVACCLMLRGDFIHPSINCEDPIPEIEDQRVPHQTEEKPLYIALKANFGFGDVNSVIVLRKWEK